jgi:hypothetical protein
MTTHYNLDRYLEEYIAGASIPGPEGAALSHDQRALGRDRQFPASVRRLAHDPPGGTRARD